MIIPSIGAMNGKLNPVSYVPWDLTNMTYVRSKILSTTNGAGIKVSPDGTTLMLIDFGIDKIIEYSMSTAWDISTISATGRTFSYGSQDGDMRGVAFSPDGTKMYLAGNTSTEKIYEYSLSTGWNLSSVSYQRSATINSQTTYPYDLDISPDGTTLMIIHYSGDSVLQYSLSTAWNISTRSYVGSKSIGTAYPNGFALSPDGKTFIVGDSQYNELRQFDMTTAFSVSTASLTLKKEYPTPSKSYYPTGIAVSPDASVLIEFDSYDETLHQYSL